MEHYKYGTLFVCHLLTFGYLCQIILNLIDGILIATERLSSFKMSKLKWPSVVGSLISDIWECLISEMCALVNWHD